MIESILKTLEEIKPSLLEHMHNSMLYKLNVPQLPESELVESRESAVSVANTTKLSDIPDIDSDFGDF
jgi:hypothetical protein